jgi:predicted nucleic acid-binding Zn ribbon protein
MDNDDRSSTTARIKNRKHVTRSPDEMFPTQAFDRGAQKTVDPNGTCSVCGKDKVLNLPDTVCSRCKGIAKKGMADNDRTLLQSIAIPAFETLVHTRPQPRKRT